MFDINHSIHFLTKHIKGGTKSTALIQASYHGHEDSVIVLLEAGADHRIKDIVSKSIIIFSFHFIYYYFLLIPIFIFLIDSIDR